MLEINSKNIRAWSRLGSCGAFGIAAVELGQTKENLGILTADLCFYSGLERFKKAYPEKLYNVGIAEQNMIGVAAGMAKEGMNIFATTYATFASTRCCDQVRVNMGYMQLPIKLVGLTSGLSVGILGGTHISCEDVAIFRAIPNITILSPADCTETVKAVIAAAEMDSPVYLRLSGAMNNQIVYKEDYEFTIGKAVVLEEGNDIALIATGPMVATAQKVSKKLGEEGISCRVVDMHTIKPLDVKAVKDSMKCKLIVTLEEHSIIGGLGGAVSEVLADEEDCPPQQIIGISDEFKHAADYDYLIRQDGVDADTVFRRIKERYKV